MLRDHLGMRLTRHVRAVFWWCYSLSERPLPAARIIVMMPNDTYLENAWQQAERNHPTTATIPGWGDAICWRDEHDVTLHHNTRD